MQSNSPASNKSGMPEAESNMPHRLARVGLCFSVAGLVGVFTASFVSYLEQLGIPKAMIATVITLFTFLSVPGLLMSLVALYGKRPSRAAFYGVLLGLIGVLYLPTMVNYWIRSH